MQLLNRTNFALLLVLSFSVGYLISSTVIAQAQQNNTFPNPPPVVTNPVEPEDPIIITPPPNDNIAGIIALITSIGAIVAIVVRILPQSIDIIEKISGIKFQQKEQFLEISKSIGESDFWQLENMERLRSYGKGILMIAPSLNKILEKPEVQQALIDSKEELDRVKEGLTTIENAIPKKEEIKAIQEELNNNARDPNKAG